MNFSFLLPTRERPAQLSQLLQSLDETTADKSNFEVWAAYDNDDQSTLDIKSQLLSQYPWLRMCGRNRSTNMSADYFNWIRDMAQGKYLIATNDDAIMRTQNWDQIALEKLREYTVNKPDNVLYGWISDSLTDRAGGVSYCCFPLISAIAARILGYVLHPGFRGWTADIHIYRLFSSIERVCDLSSIWLEHVSYHCGTAARDATSHNMEHISREPPNPPLEPDIHKLLEYIKMFER